MPVLLVYITAPLSRIFYYAYIYTYPKLEKGSMSAKQLYCVCEAAGTDARRLESLFVWLKNDWDNFVNRQDPSYVNELEQKLNKIYSRQTTEEVLLDARSTLNVQAWTHDRYFHFKRSFFRSVKKIYWIIHVLNLFSESGDIVYVELGETYLKKGLQLLKESETIRKRVRNLMLVKMRPSMRDNDEPKRVSFNPNVSTFNMYIVNKIKLESYIIAINRTSQPNAPPCPVRSNTLVDEVAAPLFKKKAKQNADESKSSKKTTIQVLFSEDNTWKNLFKSLTSSALCPATGNRTCLILKRARRFSF